MSRMTGLSTAEFDRMVASGEIREGSRVYLWDGEVRELMSENQPHVNACEILRDLVAERLVRARWTVNSGRPVELSDGFKPHPDLSVLRGPRDDYDTRAPAVADVALLVEVADTSYPIDSKQYLERYAREGIVQYWIVNVRARRVEVYLDPDRAAGEYGAPRCFGLDAAVPLVLVARDGRAEICPEVPVAEILRSSLKRPNP